MRKDVTVPAHLLGAAALLVLAPGGAEAQDKAAARGKQVIEEALRALGGDRFLAMRDRVETGRVYSFYRDQLRGLSRATIYTRYVTPPDPPEPGKLYVRERTSFGKPKEEDYAILFSEDKGWQITFRGARPIPDDTLLRYRETTTKSILYILRQRLKEPGLLIESKGTNVFDNQPVETVDITDANNHVVTVYFHFSTKLPIRQVFYRRDPKTKQRFEEVTLYSKYRDVGGGAQWPLTIQRQRDNEKIFEIFSETVTINQDLDESYFTLPVSMKLLPPAR
jgi:hypothetical protein